jgi:drug/metabolite transporter (DMT)-like permease
MLQSRSVGALEVAAGAALISFSPVFVKLAHVGPVAAGVYRVLFGGLALVAVAAARGKSFWTGWGAASLVIACGVLFALDLIVWHTSIHYVGPGLSTILGNFQVFVLAGVGVALMGERPGWRLWVAIPLAVSGLFLLVGMRWSEVDRTYHLGVLFGLLTAVLYASYLLTLRYMQSGAGALHPTASVGALSLVTAAILAPTAVAAGESLVIPDGRTWAVLLGYGLLAHALGWAMISAGLPRVPASRAGLLLLLQPSLAFVWDIVLFDRPTTPVEAAGAIVTLGAIYLGSAQQKPG